MRIQEDKRLTDGVYCVPQGRRRQLDGRIDHRHDSKDNSMLHALERTGEEARVNVVSGEPKLGWNF